jgi:hypothetical protein
MNELRSMTSQLRIVAGQEHGRSTSPFASTTHPSSHDHDDFECSCFSHTSGSTHRQQMRRVREPVRHRVLRKR